MKACLLLLVSIYSISWLPAQADRLLFKSESFPEAQRLLQGSNQIIFVTATADWCEPCRLMEQSVFADSRVGSFYNKNFYNLKINIDKGQGPYFALQYEVDTLPALLYLTPDGTLLEKTTGYTRAQRLLDLGLMAMNPATLDKALSDRYQAGDRKPEFLLSYLKRVEAHQQQSIIEEYLANKKSWTDPASLKLLFKLDVDALVRHFDFIVHHQQDLGAIFSARELHDKLLDLVQTKLYCSPDTATIEQATAWIKATKLKETNLLTASYAYFYYKEVKKDLPAYRLALIDAWTYSGKNLDKNRFNEELAFLIRQQPPLDVYKPIAQLVRKNKNLLSSPETLRHMLAWSTELKLQSKTKYWNKRLSKLVS